MTSAQYRLHLMLCIQKAKAEGFEMWARALIELLKIHDSHP